MIGEGPPSENGASRSVTHSSSENRNKKCNRIHLPDYARERKLPLLIVQRLRAGLLNPFQCVLCGGVAFDPVGRNAKGEHICEGCVSVADMIERNRR